MDRISQFVDSFIPKNLPKERKQMLRYELEDHIFEKTAFYEEIGYTREQSIEKAIEEFGEGEDMRKHIFNEFEELYAERSIFGIIAFFVIMLMNCLCWPLDTWVTSADFNRDPDVLGTAISFLMIFVMLSMIVFARIKKYRKMLFAIGFANILVAVCVLVSFYPQMAAFAIAYNFIYFVDNFTPFLLGNLIANAMTGIFAMFFWFGFLLIPAIYALITSFLLKKGKAKAVKNPKKKAALFCSVYLSIAVVSCMLQPVGQQYADDYPVWFFPYTLYISEMPEEIFSKLYPGMSEESANEVLYSYGYQNLEDYRASLDWVTKKQFDANVKEFDFVDGYTIWFLPDVYIPGEGFVGVKSENGTVTGVGIGNLNNRMYDADDYNSFGYSEIEFNHDIEAMTESFRALQKGADEADVINIFTDLKGQIYTKRLYVENGEAVSYYRIYFYGVVNPEMKHYLDKYDSRYIELTFKGGKLIKGNLYSERNQDGESIVSVEYVK